MAERLLFFLSVNVHFQAPRGASSTALPKHTVRDADAADVTPLLGKPVKNLTESM
jgi:hypothetical protein